MLRRRINDDVVIRNRRREFEGYLCATPVDDGRRFNRRDGNELVRVGSEQRVAVERNRS